MSTVRTLVLTTKEKVVTTTVKVGIAEQVLDLPANSVVIVRDGRTVHDVWMRTMTNEWVKTNRHHPFTWLTGQRYLHNDDAEREFNLYAAVGYTVEVVSS